jgi:drug/metabolite transporter (DMT)-like permease
MPLAALLAQLHFATKYPNDNLGPIKGAYMQFVAPVMCALFGLGVGWMWRRRARWRWRLAALAALAALVFVALYSVHARLPRFGPNSNTAAPFFLKDSK